MISWDRAKEVMGVDLVLDEDQLTMAWRRRCKEGEFRHPDVGGDAKKFQELMEADAMLRSSLKFGRTGDAGESEKSFAKKLQSELTRAGALVLVVHGHSFQAAGWPDFQVYHKLWTGHLELKVAGNPVSAIQRQVIQKLRDRGTDAKVFTLVGKKIKVEDARGNWEFSWPGNCTELLTKCARYGGLAG